MIESHTDATRKKWKHGLALSFTPVLITVLAVTQLAGATGSPITAGPPVTFPDPVGDSGTALDIDAVVVANDAAGQIELLVSLPSHPELPSDANVFVAFDVDNNPNTGLFESYGIDYHIAISGADRSYAFYRWDGAGWDFVFAPTSTVRYSSGAYISINRSEFGSPDELTFYVATTKEEGGEVGGDFAPDSGTFTYVFPQPIPPKDPPARSVVTLKRMLIQGHGSARTGRPFEVRVSALLGVDNKAVAASPAHLSCSAKVLARQVGTRVVRLGSLASACRLVVPRGVRGKTLVVALKGTVSAKLEGAPPFTTRFAKTVRFRIG